MAGLIGVDTGFFMALSRGGPTATAVFEGPGELVTSALVLYELQKKLRDADQPRWREVLADLERAVAVAPVTARIALRAGELAREYGLPASAALILGSFLDVGCATVYTADKHLGRAALPGLAIISLDADG